jgi:putative membrane protein
MRYNNKLWAFALMGLMAISCGPKQNTDSNEAAEEANDDKFQSRTAEKDADFVMEAVAANYAEIELAQLAVQKSNDTEIKQVAQFLENQHTKVLAELKDVAGKRVISIPSNADDAAKRKIEDLTKEDDVKDFNKQWCKEMIDKHEASIKKFETRMNDTEDQELKSWISETLPHLREHLDRIKACHDRLAVAK